MKDRYDAIAVGAHPDDVEVFMGGTIAKLSQQGLSVRIFYRHCRMESAWDRFDFAVDVSSVYDRKLAALASYESVSPEIRPSSSSATARYVGSLVGVRYAEPFKARSPILLASLLTGRPVPFG